MNNKITKLATVAAVLLIIASAVTILNHVTKPAYAIEQTIEAMRAIKTVHISCRDWDDKKFDVWLKLDPITGKETHLYATMPSLGLTVISEPNRTYIYNEENNFVQVYDFKMAKSDISFTNLFESIVEDVVELKDTDNINIYKYRDPETNNDYIVIDVNTKKQETRILVDPQTKLPVTINRARCEEMGDVLKNADEFNYNVVIPDELAHFQIPPDARIVNSSKEFNRIADPNFGMTCENLTEEQAAIEIATKYLQAVMDKDWLSVENLRPAGTAEEWKQKYSTNPPLQLLKVDKPFKNEGCKAKNVQLPIVPCTLKFEDGSTKITNIIVLFRNINSQSSCVILGTWGS